MGKENFIGKLDELLQLFERVKEQARKEGIIFDNDPLYNNFELLSANYKLIKDSIPDDLIEEIAEPIKDIINEMLEHLKSMLGEEAYSKASGMSDELLQIDKLLAQDKLSEDEINQLLDRRKQIDQ